MYDVLLVYKYAEMQPGHDGNIIIPDKGHLTYTVSGDEKPVSGLLTTNIPYITQQGKRICPPEL